jgi:hypothetical protein
MGHRQTRINSLTMPPVLSSAGHPRSVLPRLVRLAAVMTSILGAIPGLNAAQFTLEARTVAIPENGTVQGLTLRTAQLEINLLPPPQWKMAIDTNTTTLTWQSPDFHTMLRLHLVPGSGGGASAGKESLQERVRAEFPDAEIRDEAECYTATHSGTAFELEQRKTRFPFVTRLAFLACEQGMIEVLLTCPSDESERARHRWTSVMNSLYIVPR